MINKKISIIFFLLIVPLIYGFTSTTQDWEMLGHNVENNFFSSYNLESRAVNNFQNISTNSPNQPPAFFDINSDGFSDAVLLESGLIRVYLYNSTTQNFQLKSEILDRSMDSTPYLTIQDNSLMFYGYSSGNFLAFNISAQGIISFVNQFAMANNVGLSSIKVKGSPNCLTQFGTHCIVNQEGNNWEVFNVTNPKSIISVNYSNVNKSAVTNINVKPPFYPNPNGAIPDSYALFHCNTTGSQHGVMMVDIFNGSVFSQNCSIDSKNPDANIQVHNIDGGNKEIFSIHEQGLSTSLHVLSTALVEKSGFPITNNADPNQGFSVNNDNIFLCIADLNAIEFEKYTLNGGFVSEIIASQGSAGTNIPNTIVGNDFGYCGGILFDLNKDSSEALGTNSMRHASVTKKGNEFILSITDSSLIKLYSLGEPQLGEPNATFRFLNNQTNGLLGIVRFNVTQQGNLVLVGETTASSKILLSNTLPTGNYNVTFKQTGFNLFHEEVTILNDTVTYNFSAEPNSTFEGTLILTLFNANTGLDVQEESMVNVFRLNTTTGVYVFFKNQTITGSGNITGLLNGNYSLTIITDNYQTKNTQRFVLSGVANREEALTPVIFFSQAIPFISTLELFAIRTTYEAGNVQRVEHVKPNQICVNGTVFANVTAYKGDSNPMWVNFRCDSNESHIPSANFLATSTQNFDFQCSYRTAGVKTINIFPASSNPLITLSNFSFLLETNRAKQINITVTDSCVGSLIVNNTLLKPVNPRNEGLEGIFRVLYGAFGWDTPKEITEVTYFIIIFFAFFFGIVVAVATKRFEAFVFVAGGYGLLSALFFWLINFISGIMTFLLAVIFIAIGSVALMKQFLGGGGHE